MGLSIAQCRVQLAEWTVESVMFGIGHIAEVMRQALGIAEVAIAEATSVPSQVEGQISVLLENAEASTMCAIGEMSQRLEQGIEVVVSGTAMTSARNTQAAIE